MCMAFDEPKFNQIVWNVNYLLFYSFSKFYIEFVIIRIYIEFCSRIPENIEIKQKPFQTFFEQEHSDFPWCRKAGDEKSFL